MTKRIYITVHELYGKETTRIHSATLERAIKFAMNWMCDIVDGRAKDRRERINAHRENLNSKCETTEGNHHVYITHAPCYDF